MKLPTIGIALAAVLVSACETAPENMDRRINLTWKLAPENAERTKRTVESGDIILSWAASAHATHEMVTSAGALPLAAARTTYGQVYCDKVACYEDRDANGALDYQWTIVRNGRSPGQVQWVSNPQEMERPISFRAASTAGPAIFENTLGLIYTGPLQGIPKDDQTLSPMIGELSVGWHAGAKAPRTPDGAGWSVQQNLPFVVVEGVASDTSVMPLGLTYRALKATIDGMLDLEFQATAVDGVQLDAKPQIKLDDKPTENPVSVAPPTMLSPAT